MINVSSNLTAIFKCDGILPPVGLSYFTSIASLIFSLIAITGNGLVCLCLIVNPYRNLRTPFNYFLVNLGVSDLIVGTVALPISSYTHFIEALRIEHADQTSIFHMAFFISINSSSFSLIALSFDRYAAVKWPMLYRKNINIRRSLVVTILTWVLAGSVSSVYLRIGFVPYLMIFANTTLVFTMAVLMAIYVGVHYALGGHEQELIVDRGPNPPLRRVSISLEQRQKRVTRVFLMVTFAFVGCVTPAVFIIYVTTLCSRCSCTLIQVLRDLQLLFIFATSTLHPFVCTLRLQTFRRATKRMFIRVKKFLRLSKSSNDIPSPETEISNLPYVTYRGRNLYPGVATVYMDDRSSNECSFSDGTPVENVESRSDR